jgi:hypothetical protein
VTPNVLHYLQVKGNSRNKRLDKAKTREQKRLKKKKHFLNLKRDEAIAKHERTKRDGNYRTGQNMDGEGDDDTAPPKKKSHKETVFPACGLIGHMTRRSRACLQYSGRSVAALAPVNDLNGAPDPVKDMLDFDSLIVQQQDPVDPHVAVVAIQGPANVCDSDGMDIYYSASNNIL